METSPLASVNLSRSDPDITGTKTVTDTAWILPLRSTPRKRVNGKRNGT